MSEEEDLSRGNERRNVVMMTPLGAERLGFGEGSRVVVETETGALTVCVAVTDIRAGNVAM